ncbi:MAG: fructosamine kinase family protein [Chitinophagales bacterium]|nr:fructosamine kinase family protein [Chitinophagales bacterium]
MFPQSLKIYFQGRFQIHQAESLSGGCINDCYRLNTTTGYFFIKINSASAYPGMFQAEADALKLLKQTNTVSVPEVLETGTCGNLAYLLLEYIEPGIADLHTPAEMGRQLALLHKQTADSFGLHYDNYIGSLPQRNTQLGSWAEFFVEMRLRPQTELALAKGLLGKADVEDFESLYDKLDSIFPTEKPALLHGDLWSGNYLVGSAGKPWFIDPAIYYGHREMDLAMTKLFGGFSSDFYNAYNETYPLQAWWLTRVDLCNLYPLLVHVNLFGGSYVGQLKDCLNKYI